MLEKILRKTVTELQPYNDGTLFFNGCSLKLGDDFPTEERAPYLLLMDDNQRIHIENGTDCLFYKKEVFYILVATEVRQSGLLTFLIKEIRPIGRYF